MPMDKKNKTERVKRQEIKKERKKEEECHCSTLLQLRAGVLGGRQDL